MNELTCCQVALSTSDIARSHWWYRNAFGFHTAGERRHREDQHWADVPGLPEASFDVWCLVGSRPFCQIEMFEFFRPRPRGCPSDRQLCDLGYSMIGIHCPNFDETLNRIAIHGGEFLSPIIGESGSRRVCLYDPDGILLELMEDRLPGQPDQMGKDHDVGPSLASMTISVRDLDLARRFFVEILGLEESPLRTIHEPEHDALWNLTENNRETLLIQAGDFLFELAHYDAPRGRPRPAGHLISDYGVLNVAFGTESMEAFETVYSRAVRAGFRGHTDPWTLPDVATVVYLQDPLGLSVELLHVEPAAMQRMGFLVTE